MNIIVGTAGHIDHGKTTLIKALTGTDTDRLPEEKKRGITIDLGFAELESEGVRIGFVDVPGHERFVKNMLAGASGIDLVLLIIAADEGVMPQTREHFDICRLLGIQTGIVVLTKADLVDQELLAIVRAEAEELVEGSFLEGAPVLAVSPRSGEGIAELKAAIFAAAANVHERPVGLAARLPIDRSFVIKGFGTVVTGTLAAGQFAEGDEVELMPWGQRVRVRGLQTHGKETSTAFAGQRVAANIAGIDHSDISRGMTVAAANSLRSVRIFDARVEVLKDAPNGMRSRQRVRVHIGTAEVLARIQVLSPEAEAPAGASELIQFRLERPVAAVHGERFIVRSYSPQITIAGGTILDPFPAKHRSRDIDAARELLTALDAAAGDKAETIRLFIAASGKTGISFADLKARTGWTSDVIRECLDVIEADGKAVNAGSIFVDASRFADLRTNTLSAVLAHHRREPLSKGMPREELKQKIFSKLPAELFASVITSLEAERKLVSEQDIVRSADHSLSMTAEEAAFIQLVTKEISAAGMAPAKIDEVIIKASAVSGIAAPRGLKLLSAAGDIVRVSSEFYFSRTAIDTLTETLRSRAEHLPNRLIDVPAFKDLAGVSRKYAIPLLEYFDKVGITKRAGDKRIIM